MICHLLPFAKERQYALSTFERPMIIIIIIIIDIYIAHIAEASRRLETEGGIEMT